jgi:hypothetical protein
MICLKLIKDDKDHVQRGLFSGSYDLNSMLTQQQFKESLLTKATTMGGEYDVAKYFKVEKSGMHYWESGMQKERTLLVSNGITSYYFLSNQRVKWTMYGLASLRVCITTQQ